MHGHMCHQRRLYRRVLGVRNLLPQKYAQRRGSTQPCMDRPLNYEPILSSDSNDLNSDTTKRESSIGSHLVCIASALDLRRIDLKPINRQLHDSQLKPKHYP
jgi:hypothetical protein